MTQSNYVEQIDGIEFIQLKPVTDSRGSFVKFHPLQALKQSLDSVALSFNPMQGTVRGLHFQVEPFAEEKLISCVQGSIFDVVVDLRMSSKTFGKWTSIDLNSENALQVFMPKGIAHGFQTLSPNSIVHYCLSSNYSPESSYTINPFGDLGIEWPLKTVSISEKDSGGISLSAAAKKYSDSIKA